MPHKDTTMADTYIVNHTLLGTGHVAGEVFPLSADPFPMSGAGETIKDKQGNDVLVNTQRLLDLFAIRKATDEEIAAFETKGAVDLNAMYLGDAPEGQHRVSSDTFAAVGLYHVTDAGPNQSDVSDFKAEQASKAELAGKSSKASKAEAAPAEPAPVEPVPVPA